MSKRRSKFRILLSVYLGPLALSWIVQAFRDFSPGVEPGAKVALLTDPLGGSEREVRMTYLDVETLSSEEERPVLVLLHGSPGTLNDFRDVVPRLEDRYRLIVPSLPGFGGSRADLSDYSVKAHADYVLQLLDQLEIESAHFVGFSMSGGVILEVNERAPERVKSLTLLAAIGAQEYEMFGRYGLNHTAHRAQYLALEGLRYFFPHFGVLETNPLNRHYARNFLDTDQRPLRQAMENYDGPAHVIHGATDFLVPVEAAREHARLMPQAKLTVYEDDGHFMLWQGMGHPERVATALRSFVRKAEEGTQPVRATASPERIAAAEVPFDPKNVPPLEGMALILAILAIAGATLVSEDLTCIAVGIVIAEGRLSFGAGVLGCFLGIFFGDVLLYLFGRFFGRSALKRRPLRWWLTPERLDAASAWFQTRGLQVIFASRFVPGFRVPTYVAAGVLHTPFVRFCLYFAVAVALWTPILVGFSAWAGKRALVLVESYSGWALPILGLLILGIYFLQRLVLPLFSWRGRRMLLGAWRRKTRYEFWPLPIFYLPVALQILRLAWKHKSLAVVTAANPGIPTGGFIGESKADILDELGADSPYIATYIVLDPSQSVADRLSRTRAFAEEHGLPLVLKPDVGQRGSGVVICKDLADLERRVSDDFAVKSVLQAFVAGPEYGLFWIRGPKDLDGRIFAVTDKRMPAVRGDGTKTLEELILSDERAVCMAPTYLEANSDRLTEVPPSGEEIELVSLGTHCRGAIFLDGNHLITPELTRTVAEMTKPFEGFHFGRFDVRVPSTEDLQAGENIRAIELNGVTSEATNVYDPKHSLRSAYSILFEQWRLAYEIGAENVKKGHPSSSVPELWRTWRAYRREQRSHSK